MSVSASFAIEEKLDNPMCQSTDEYSNTLQLCEIAVEYYVVIIKNELISMSYRRKEKNE